MKLFCAIIISSSKMSITVIDEGNAEILETHIDRQDSDDFDAFLTQQGREVVAALVAHKQDIESIIIESSEDPSSLIDILGIAGYDDVYALK